MIRRLAVLLALAVVVLGLAVAWTPGGAEPALEEISAPGPRSPSGPAEPTGTDDRPASAPAGGVDRAGRAPVDRSTSRTTRRVREAVPARAQEGRDFTVSLDRVSPVIPRSGPLRLSGTVTNVSEQTWTSINVHPLTSFYPMTSARELQVSAASDPEIYLGPRITEAGAFDNSIETLGPGETARWSVRIRRDLLRISEEEGVYWVGVHVLGADEDGLRDGTAHGRARSFVPLVGRGRDRVPTSLVLPVRRIVERTPEGRLADVAGWTEALSPGGRLANLLDFARTSRDLPLTWVIDPAVPAAVRQLARGNPELSLAPSGGAGDGSEGGDASEDGGEGGDEADGDEEPAAGDDPAEQPEPDPDAIPAVQPAKDWLDDLAELTTGRRVLGLPYGDVDVVAAADNAPGLYARARALSETTFDELGILAQPAVLSPSGLLTDAALALVPDDVEVLLSDEALPARFSSAESGPSTITVAGNRVAVYDAAAGTGGPGPDRRLARVALRQRILAEAAVRSLAGGSGSLQVVLPPGFDPGTGGRAFFAGLDQRFVDPRSAGVDPTGPAPEVAEVTYPQRQLRRELPAAQLASAQQLVEAGQTLDGILPGTDAVAPQVLAQALTGVSYETRDDPEEAALATRRTADRIRDLLGLVRIEAPSFVILSSETGPFAVTVTNDLDQPVELRIEAYTADDLVIRAPEKVELEAGTQQTVELDAEARSIGVHAVRLVAAGEDGSLLGSSDVLNVRSNSVGTVIWVILGVGVGILFLAIPVRWARRRRRAAREGGTAPALQVRGRRDGTA
ncbi:DUF6049 family protein [Nocardioides donggukensis]|uniref:Uncharacterized protein n=1 Tax=Nocardioides donggukensis TaxID=2774019 RepID=A0A927KB82_9ACTN|nr:DUF6049 family protein [Nocardioides donggukensis]MBD8871000.1 hypothetical protein [Nocardioides donggukensis]